MHQSSQDEALDDRAIGIEMLWHESDEAGRSDPQG